MSLRDLYECHRYEPFPERWRGARVEGHCLLTIDAQVGACMAVFFERRGELGNYGTWVLQEFHTDLSEVLESLGEGREGADPYFRRMHRISAGMLAHLSRREGARKRERRWWQRPVRRQRQKAG